MPRRLLVALASVALATLAFAGPAFAAPANDTFADARAVDALPFTDELDLDGAGTEAGEPQYCNFQAQTVWYSITSATTQAVRINLNGSDFGVVANAYQAWSPGLGGLGFVGCIGYGGSLDLTIEPGATYYIQAGSVSPGTAHLRLNVEPRLPPDNDAFSAAREVGALPYFDTGDATLATLEPDESAVPPGAWTPITGSVWYRFTPTTDGFYTFTVNASFSSVLTMYTGSSLGSLTAVPATSQFGRLTFRGSAGTAYMFQLGRAFVFGGAATYSLRVEATPSPSVAVLWSPPDPSMFDTVQFSGHVFDLIAGTIASLRWDFGDGTTSTEFSPQHRYDADGDYAVTLEVTMTDGRVGSATQTVQVRTHDVAITKLIAPPSAHAGQTRDVVASIQNRRYPETAQVTLWKADPAAYSGFTAITSATIDVPTSSGGQTTSLTLPYTFTADDAAIGKVTLRVTVTLLGARDALPADNTAVALPTKVKP